MKIGALAAATDTPIQTIRYYEREGLLPAPGRSEGNYRVYGEAQAQRLAFIRRCRALDMSLDEVRSLLRWIDAPGGDCTDVNALLDEHIGHVEARIAELKRLRRELRELRAHCLRGGPQERCGILLALRAQRSPRGSAAAGHVRGTTHAKPQAGPAGRPRRAAQT